jgi:hypothetical protein
VDPQTRKPVVQLAIEGKLADGWYRLGKVTVKETLKQRSGL